MNILYKGGGVMIPSAHVIKRTAKSQLRNHWVSAMVVSVVFMLAISFFSVLLGLITNFFSEVYKEAVALRTIVSAAYCITTLATVIPLFHGMLRWFWYLGLEKRLSLGNLFYYFSEWKLYLKSLLFYISLLGRVLMLAVLCILPAAVLRIIPEVLTLEELISDSHTFDMLIYFASVALLVVGLAVAFIFSMKYFTAPLLAVIAEEKEAEELLEIARELKLSKGSCVVFIASFLGWIALSYLGLILLYTLPYFLMSYAVAVRFAVTNHRYEMSRWGLPPLI